MTRLREYWTLGKRPGDGGWMVLSIEQDMEGSHHLDAEIVASPWGDDRRLRDEALVEGAVADKVLEGYKVSDVADLDFDGDARTAALDLSLADGRFAPDVLEAAVRAAVDGWTEAVDGEDDKLLALATPGAAHDLLYPDKSEKRRLVVRGPRVTALRIVALDAAAEPPTMTVEVDVKNGSRYIQDRDTAAVLKGDAEKEKSFTERWLMGLSGDDRNPWQIVDANASRATPRSLLAGRSAAGLTAVAPPPRRAGNPGRNRSPAARSGRSWSFTHLVPLYVRAPSFLCLFLLTRWKFGRDGPTGSPVAERQREQVVARQLDAPPPHGPRLQANEARLRQRRAADPAHLGPAEGSRSARRPASLRPSIATAPPGPNSDGQRRGDERAERAARRRTRPPRSRIARARISSDADDWMTTVDNPMNTTPLKPPGCTGRATSVTPTTRTSRPRPRPAARQQKRGRERLALVRPARERPAAASPTRAASRGRSPRSARPAFRRRHAARTSAIPGSMNATGGVPNTPAKNVSDHQRRDASAARRRSAAASLHRAAEASPPPRSRAAREPGSSADRHQDAEEAERVHARTPRSGRPCASSTPAIAGPDEARDLQGSAS